MSLPAMTPGWWARIGRHIGQELAQLDLHRGRRQHPDDLPMPAGTPPAYRNALRLAYARTIAGLEPPL